MTKFLPTLLVFQLLSQPVGFRNANTGMSLLTAVAQGVVDPVKAVLLSEYREMSAGELYAHGGLSLRGALRLAALLDVHPSLVASSARRNQKKRIRRPGQKTDDHVKITLAEAMKQGERRLCSPEIVLTHKYSGLVDSRMRFRQGTNDLSLEDAITAGVLDPHNVRLGIQSYKTLSI